MPSILLKSSFSAGSEAASLGPSPISNPSLESKGESGAFLLRPVLDFDRLLLRPGAIASGLTCALVGDADLATAAVDDFRLFKLVPKSAA